MNPRIVVPLFTLIAFSIVMMLAGVAVAPHDVWPNVLLAGCFLSGIGLGGGLLIAIHDASHGTWLGPVRQIACSLTRLIIPGCILALLAIVFGGSYLYPGFHEPIAGFRGLWLGRTFFTTRAIAYALTWIALPRLLKRYAPAYIVLFAVTVWLASVDWIMSLEDFASTMFGVYRFAGLFTAALAVIAIVTVARSRHDPSITSDHIHDVAKLFFGFSTFWMYIWFSQGMLIWYSNLPDETRYYAARAYGNWGVLFWTVVVLMWALPFFVLLSEKTKRNRTILLRVAIATLIGHWLDLYVMILPAHSPTPDLTGWDLALALGTFAAVGWAVTKPASVRLPQLQPA